MLTKQLNIKASCKDGSAINLDTDKNLLQRLLLEIMDNAIKYNKKNGEVVVDVRQQEDGLLIEVRDTGIGITDEQQPLIFTKFFRGTNYDTSKIPGAGLGLFISHAYIQIVKGKIWFKSETGKGTSFFILLPKAKA